MIDQGQTLVQKMGASAARYCITSAVSILAVHLALHFQSIWIEAATQLLGSVLVVLAMLFWSHVEKTRAGKFVTGVLKAALALNAGASIDEAIALAKQLPATQSLADAAHAEVTTIVTAQPSASKDGL